MDYYNTLGVAKNATPDEIKKAYRKLASQHHPDKGGDTNKFQDIQTAYDTLSDPNKKQAYDNPVQNNFPGGFTFNFGDNLHEIFGFNNINDLIRKQGRHGTQLLRTRIDITLTEAYFGITKSLKIQTQGQPSIPVNLNIPKGIQNGQQIRFEGLIPNAVLIVEFSVLSDLKFDRKGNDLYCNQSVNMLELITGTKFTFTTISGKVLEIPIKPLTQPYMNLKLSGQGMPLFNNPTYGDQIILIKPFIPDNINTEIIDVINKYKN